jgi:hypothetical protein
MNCESRGAGPFAKSDVAYVAALQAADNHDFGPLMAFVRS